MKLVAKFIPDEMTFAGQSLALFDDRGEMVPNVIGIDFGQKDGDSTLTVAIAVDGLLVRLGEPEDIEACREKVRCQLDQMFGDGLRIKTNDPGSSGTCSAVQNND